jgi:hypothetical protein
VISIFADDDACSASGNGRGDSSELLGSGSKLSAKRWERGFLELGR